MDASSLLCYPSNGQQPSSHLLVANASGSSSSPLPIASLGAQMPLVDATGSWLVLVHIRKSQTGWYWFSLLDFTLPAAHVYRQPQGDNGTGPGCSAKVVGEELSVQHTWLRLWPH